MPVLCYYHMRTRIAELERISAMNLSDEELYDRFLKQHTEDDFRVLFEKHKETLILFLNGFVHNLDDAEELMIDTFAETAAGRTLFARRSSFKTWLFAIGKKLALMHLRKTKRTETVSVDAEEESLPDKEAALPELELLKEERNRHLYSALNKIHSDYRTVLMLLYFEDMSHEEAAAVMGKNKKQVYHLAERGKKALREIMEKEGFGNEII